jgi:Cu/Ag efflux protein CusF
MRASAGILRFATALSASIALLSAGCSPPAELPAVPVETYAMRGEIVRLPTAQSPEIAIRHEAVPDFRDEAGKVVGMEAMTMPFALAPGVEPAGLAPGDKVAFTLEMRWKATSDIVRISRMERLAAGTLLSWETPAPLATESAPTGDASPDGTGEPPR